MSLDFMLNPMPEEHSRAPEAISKNNQALYNEAALALADLSASTAPRPTEWVRSSNSEAHSDPARDIPHAKGEHVTDPRLPADSDGTSTMLSGVELYAQPVDFKAPHNEDTRSSLEIPSTEAVPNDHSLSIEVPRTNAIAHATADMVDVPMMNAQLSDNVEVDAPLSQEDRNLLLSIEEPESATMQTKAVQKRRASKSGGKKKATTPKGPPAKKRKLDTPSSTTKKTAANGRKSESVDPKAMDSTQAKDEPQSDGGEDEEDDSDDGQVYCICRGPDDGTVMIGCDGECEDWFHAKCVGITEKDRLLIDRYICTECEKKGVALTTWKRMCRKPGCRNPARLEIHNDKRNKVTSAPSKYCSDQCGIQLFEHMLKSARPIPKAKSAKTQLDLGPMGGALSASELRALVDSAAHIDDFKRLGDGILSPPPTPPEPDTQSDLPKQAISSTQHERLAIITLSKERLRARYLLLKDKIKFINMSKAAATQLAESKGMKPRELCGYDPRISWDEPTFELWRTSAEGQNSLAHNVLLVTIDEQGNVNGANDAASGEGQVVCSRKKCARHLDWAKLANEDARSQIVENSETRRALDAEERELLETAGIRARAVRADDRSDYVETHIGSSRGADNAHMLDAGVGENTPKEVGTMPGTPAEDVAHHVAPLIESQAEDLSERRKDVIMTEPDLHGTVG